MKYTNYFALGISLAPATLAVWLFYNLGFLDKMVVSDRFCVFEFWMSVVFLLLIVFGLIYETRRLHRVKKNGTA